MNFSFDNGILNFYDCNGAGWKGLLFELNGELSCTNTVIENTLNQRGGMVVLAGNSYQQKFEFSLNEELKSLVVKREILNTGNALLNIESISDGLLDKNGCLNIGTEITPIDYFKARYFHSSNIKTEKFPRFRVEYPYVRCLPYDKVHFNHDEANHFPAFGICDMDYKTTLVEGDLNQVKFERSWEIGLEGDNMASVPAHYRGIQRYTLSDGLSLEPGQKVEVSRVFYQIKNNCNPQDAFSDYVDSLSAIHRFRGPETRILNEAVYCTWNYGARANINEDNILQRAAIVADKLSGCTHFLIDDGFQDKRNNRNAGICSFYPEPVKGYDKEKFPKGMRYISDEIRKLGLTPCIWLSPKIYLDSDLARKKPEWLLKNDKNSPDLIDGSGFLDLSVKEAREFYLQVLDALFVNWNYEGVKYDFMTQWFLMESNRFAHGSGIEWRDFAFSEIRKRIGPQGFFMTCIAFSAGNPFPGLYADCYRCGFDIHDGTWAEQIRSCEGTLAQVLLKGKDTFLLNMDSLGFSDIPVNEQYFRFTWCFITQGLIEIGGLLEQHTDEQFAKFNRILQNMDRGNKVICLDEKALLGEPLPEILQVKYPEDSRLYKRGIRQHLAFFNWSDEKKIISVSAKKAGLEPGAVLTDFWTDETQRVNGEFLTLEVNAHSALLMQI